METVSIIPIARIHSSFPQKFGIPRQSNIVESLVSTIVFEPPYRNADALRGIDDFDYLWLIWQFSQNVRSQWSPTVRPPRLGGNRRMGVFATRSSFRPNALAISSVRLLDVEWHSPEGPRLHVGGADLMDGTPIFDIKPYLPYTDAHPDARSGFAPTPASHLLRVQCPPQLLAKVDSQQQSTLLQILANDPRPSYHDDDREYGMSFGKNNLRFKVLENNTLVVLDIK